ncbi:MAG: cytochrome c [Spirosomataceae bacterium]
MKNEQYRFLPILLGIGSLVLIFLAEACQSSSDIKREQYFVEGMELYKIHCANCHQMDGKGLQNLYPPIANSDFLTNQKQYLACGIKYGITDSLRVNGKVYTQAMPANTQLKNIEIAEILTYIYNKWGNEKEITPTETVKEWLDACEQKQ